MNRVQGFPPVVERGARVLILGSMPGRESLAKHKYYALPQNAFWRIMGDLFGAHVELPYEERLRAIVRNGIALWDVLESCYRPGSLDSAIDAATARSNDFKSLFREHGSIGHVVFNGRKASNLYMRSVFPTVEEESGAKSYCTLPSTSPAFASMSYAEKLDQWKAINLAL